MDNLHTSNTTNENLLFVILNTMYNDNNRQIQNLTQHNNQILNILTNMLNTNNYRRNNRYQYNRNNRNNRNNTNINNTNTNTNTNTNINNSNTNTNRNNINNTYRALFNNTPYIIDNIHTQNIPRTYLPILSENNPSQQRTRASELFNIFNNFFDPIVIYPTSSQIETATRRVRYCDIVSPINRSCPISLDNFNDNDMVTVIRFCGHIFNTEHLNTWFQSNCRCPVCRYDIRNYNSSVNNSSIYNETNNQQTTNNSLQNNSSETIEERNNINQNQSIINLFQDISGNLVFDSSDPQIILNLFNSLSRI